MPTLPVLQTYPFDPTGQAATNLVVGEQHAVQEANFRDYYYVVPIFAPFFAADVIITFTEVGGTVRTLVEGEDYYFALPFIGATRSIGVPLYGAISLNNSIISGSISLHYRTVGGDFTTDPATILQNLALLAYNPRTALWDVITDKPAVFPPINHPQDIDTIFGQEDLINSILALASTIANTPSTTINITPGGGGGGTTVVSENDYYAVSATSDVIQTGQVATFKVVAPNPNTPNTLYWTVVFWNATSGNFSSVTGAFSMSLVGGVKTGSFNMTCNNAAATPASFMVAVHTDSNVGAVVAISDIVSITSGDKVVARSGLITLNNPANVGVVFSGDNDSGLCNPSDGVLDLVVNGVVALNIDTTTNTRTFFFGPNDEYRFVCRADGVVAIYDNNNSILFSSDTVATISQVSASISALYNQLHAEIEAMRVTDQKLYFFGQL